MALPQLVGLACVACGKSIASIVDSTFCAACGNPVHVRCAEQPRNVDEAHCASCGGDPKAALAVEVQRTRALRIERGVQPTPSPAMGPYPISRVCPQCGGESYEKRRPEGWIAFDSDRVCTACGMRYTPPTPIWAAIVFILVGVLLAGAFGLSWIIGFAVGRLPGPALACEGFLIFLGIMAIIFGFRSLLRVGQADHWPESRSIPED